LLSNTGIDPQARPFICFNAAQAGSTADAVDYERPSAGSGISVSEIYTASVLSRSGFGGWPLAWAVEMLCQVLQQEPDGLAAYLTGFPTS